MSQRKTTRRYREIASVLTRNGFDWLWSRWGIGSVIGSLHHGDVGDSPASKSQPERLRLTLEELGTSFIKIGQVLSTRPDLLPEDYIAELSKLQDHVPQVPYDEICAAIVRELGGEPETVFQSFDKHPRAAASIAQVHDAVLQDGTRVVVKVRRPGIEESVEQDLGIIGQVARFLSQNAEIGKRLDLEGLSDEFAYSIRAELDLTREGQNAERIATESADDPSIHVPKIYWDYSSHGVLTMEEVVGIKIDDLAALDAAGIDRKELAKRCAHIALVQVLEHGFFHADPHPGNFFVYPDGVVGLIDYGMVGRLDPRLRESLIRIALAVSKHDVERVIDELQAMGAACTALDRQGLARDLDHLLDRYDGVSLGSMSAGQLFRDISSTAFKHGLTLPSDLMLVVRVVAMDEGMGANLDPDFNLIEFSQPYFKRFWKESHSVEVMTQRLGAGAFDFADIGMELPARLLRLMGQVERGEIRVLNRIELSEPAVKELRQSVNRVAVCVLLAGAMMGTAVLAVGSSPGGSEWFVTVLPKLMFLGCLGTGIWLGISFWKSSR